MALRGRFIRYNCFYYTPLPTKKQRKLTWKKGGFFLENREGSWRMSLIVTSPPGFAAGDPFSSVSKEYACLAAPAPRVRLRGDTFRPDAEAAAFRIPASSPARA